MPKADAADEREDDEREDDGRAFGSLELHAVGLNKKPAQLKAALVFLKCFWVSGNRINHRNHFAIATFPPPP
jgi:hypothetical protein